MRPLASICALAALLTPLHCAGSREIERAFLLVHERTDGEVQDSAELGGKWSGAIAAQGYNLTVKTTVVNAGSAPASDVRLSLPKWPEDQFQLLEGMFEMSVPALESGKSLKHVMVVKPLKACRLEKKDTAAVVTYKDEAAGGVDRVGTAVGFDVEVMSNARYLRLTSGFLKEWTQFTLLAAITCVLPWYTWATARRTWEEHLRDAYSK